MATITLSNLPMNKAIPHIKAIRFAFGLGLCDAKYMFDYMKSIGKNSITAVKNPNRTFKEICTFIHSSETNLNVSMDCCNLPNVIVTEDESDNWDFSVSDLLRELMRKNSLIESMNKELKELYSNKPEKPDGITITIVMDGKTISIGNADYVNIE